MENKNNSPVNIRFVPKTSEIFLKTSEAATPTQWSVCDFSSANYYRIAMQSCVLGLVPHVFW